MIDGLAGCEPTAAVESCGYTLHTLLILLLILLSPQVRELGRRNTYVADAEKQRAAYCGGLITDRHRKIKRINI